MAMKKKFICTVCGYVHEGDTPPAECPICHAPGSKFKEMTEKNPGMTLEEVEKDIRKRDWQDSHREVSPLKQAEDAVLLDNSRLTLEETAKAIMEICEKKWEVRRANV